MLRCSTFRQAKRSKYLASVLAVVVCCSLLFSTLVLAKPAPVNGQGQSRRGKPQAGPPAANLPNLDEVRSKRHPRPQAPPHLPSTIRSRRKPLAPRNGRKVGDPLPIGFESLPDQKPNRGLAADANAKDAKDARFSAKGEGRFPLRAAENSLAASGLRSSPSLVRSQGSKLNHTGRSLSSNSGTRSLPIAAPQPIGDDQYVQNFFSYALVRQPYANEQAYWDDMVRAAYPHGQTSMDGLARDGKDVV